MVKRMLRPEFKDIKKENPQTALYLRVSSIDQAVHGYSIEGQRDRLMAYIKSRDWIFVKEYCDPGYSGASLQRPGMTALRRDMARRNKPFGRLLVWRLDRLSRSMKDTLALIDEMKENGIEFASVTESIDTSSPAGRLQLNTLASVAQYEHESIIERTRLGLERKIREGGYTGGVPPYGYTHEGGDLILEPGEYKTVRIIGALVKQGSRFGQVATELNKMGLKPRRGPRWRPKAIERIFDNPIYVGYLNRNDTDGRPIPGKHPAIWSLREWDYMQRKLNQYRKPGFEVTVELCEA